MALERDRFVASLYDAECGEGIDAFLEKCDPRSSALIYSYANRCIHAILPSKRYPGGATLSLDSFKGQALASKFWAHDRANTKVLTQGIL